MKKLSYSLILLSGLLSLMACESPTPLEPESTPTPQSSPQPNPSPTNTSTPVPVQPTSSPQPDQPSQPNQPSQPSPSSTPDIRRPEIEKISHTQGNVGMALTVLGKHLHNVQGVKFNQVNAQFELVNQEQMRLYVPGGLVDGFIVFETQADPIVYPQRFSVTNTVIFVDQAARGQNNGTNWQDAFTQLQDALVSAGPDDEIWVASGKYRPSASGDRTASFQLKTNLALYGGFNGSESNRNQRNWEKNQTILSGDLSKNDNYTDNSISDMVDNSYHIVEGAFDTSLDGFIIEGGQAGGPDNQAHGGGMYNYQTKINLKNLIFRHNRATQDGGALFLNASQATLENIVFEANFSSDKGGAISHRSNSISQITDSQFLDNQASVQGGAIFNSSAQAMIQTSDFERNTTAGTGYGGAIANTSGGKLQLKSLTFNQNTAQNGGAIYHHENAELTLEDSLFEQNEAEDNGGAIYSDQARSLQLTQVQFLNNQITGFGGGGALFNQEVNPDFNQVIFSNNRVANSHGGAIWNHQSDGFYRNLVLVGNRALQGRGGAIYNDDSSPKIYQATLAQNQAKFAGGMYNFGTSNPQIFNSILWGFVDNPVIVTTENPLALYQTIVQGIGSLEVMGENNRGHNPEFENETNPAGQDGLFFTSDDGLRLKSTSPAVDVGKLVSDGPTSDILGKAHHKTPDLGAYEYLP